MSDLIQKTTTTNHVGEEVDQSGKAVVPHSDVEIVEKKMYPLAAQVKKIEKAK